MGELSPVSYQRRVVAFYDVLGWRDHIKRAGVDPERIGLLRRIVLKFSDMLTLQQEDVPLLSFSTFSDNVVFSCPTSEEGILHVLVTLGCFQLGAAAAGFLIRGGMTVGDILHDRGSVFGPALNRAYELESKVACVPRVLLDSVLLEELRPIPFFIAKEDGVNFLDPFTLQFMNVVKSVGEGVPAKKWKEAGVAAGRGFDEMSNAEMLVAVLEGVKPMLSQPLSSSAREKVSWVYDRIVRQLGLASDS
jgi:hypothetical protein